MSKAKADKSEYTKTISDFCQLMADVQKEYEWAVAEVRKYDGLTQDYLHQLELDDLNYKGRARIATKISHDRQNRRRAKDTIARLSPMVEYLRSDEGKRAYNKFREILGSTRKIEKDFETRIYRPRVL